MVEPFPLFSLYLFYFGNDKYKKFHKNIIKVKTGKLVNPEFFMSAVLNAVTWYLYRFWKILFTIAAKRCGQINKERNIPVLKQILDIFSLNLLYQIPPFAYCRYKLYIKENRENIHKFIFRSDLPCFHDYINRNVCGNYEKLIADKQLFSAELNKLNIPSIKTICVADRNTEADMYFRKYDIFCKPVCGSQSRNAFKLKFISDENRYEIHPVNGKKILGKNKITSFLKQITGNEKLLLQDCLKDHQCLSKINNSEEITTLRIITAEFKDKQISPIYMQLEVPVETKHEKNFKQFYRIYPLDLDIFEVNKNWKRQTKVKYDKNIIIPESLKKLMAESVKHCLNAHKNLLHLKSAAFDLALTPGGPVIIEANYNWNTEMLYNIINTEPLTYNENIPASLWLREQMN